MDKSNAADLSNANMLNQTQAVSAAKLPPSLKIMQLYVQGKKLKNLDKGRDKSDYFCLLKMKWQQGQADWLEVDQTEVVFDSLDPKWEHCFSVVFNLGQVLHLRFEVYDQDQGGQKQLVGAHETTLTDLMKQSWNVERQLEGNIPDAGHICVNVNEKQESNYMLHLELCAKDLPKMTKISEFNFATTYFMEIWKG